MLNAAPGSTRFRTFAVAMMLPVIVTGCASANHAPPIDVTSGTNPPQISKAATEAAVDRTPSVAAVATQSVAVAPVRSVAKRAVPSKSAAKKVPLKPKNLAPRATIRKFVKPVPKPAPKPAPKPTPTPVRTTSFPVPSGAAADVLRLTNAERAKAGCAPLVANSALTRAAQAHSTDMARRNYFSHTSLDGRGLQDRLRAVGYGYRTAGENIAAGQRSASTVVTAWMNSAGHRKNMLNCAFKQLGVGAASGGSYGIYWTQNFGG